MPSSSSPWVWDAGVVGCSLWPSTRRGLFSPGVESQWSTHLDRLGSRAHLKEDGVSRLLAWNEVIVMMTLLALLHQRLSLSSDSQHCESREKTQVCSPRASAGICAITDVSVGGLPAPTCAAAGRPGVLNPKNLANGIHPQTLLHQNDGEFRIVTTQGAVSTKLSTLA